MNNSTQAHSNAIKSDNSPLSTTKQAPTDKEVSNALYDIQVLLELLANNIRTDNPRASEIIINNIDSILCPIASHFEDIKNQSKEATGGNE